MCYKIQYNTEDYDIVGIAVFFIFVRFQRIK